MERIGLRMHAINRMARGEQGLDWELAEVVRRLGRLVARASDDPDLRPLFGDGYSRGTLDKAAQRQWLIDRLLPSEDRNG